MKPARVPPTSRARNIILPSLRELAGAGRPPACRATRRAMTDAAWPCYISMRYWRYIPVSPHAIPSTSRIILCIQCERALGQLLPLRSADAGRLWRCDLATWPGQSSHTPNKTKSVRLVLFAPTYPTTTNRYVAPDFSVSLGFDPSDRGRGIAGRCWPTYKRHKRQTNPVTWRCWPWPWWNSEREPRSVCRRSILHLC